MESPQYIVSTTDSLASHYSDVVMTAMASQIKAYRLFAQPFIEAQIKESIKAPSNSPLTGELPT